MSNKLSDLKKLGDKKPTVANHLLRKLEFIKASSDGFRQKWDNEILKLVKRNEHTKAIDITGRKPNRR